MQKHITLKAYCAKCLNLVFKQVFIVKIKSISSLEKSNDIILKQFPDTLTCCSCNNNQMLRSYSFVHEHQFTKEDALKRQKEIDRCKEQIAATMDYNNDISHEDRHTLRESFQKQLAKLLEPNNIFTTKP
ncbi:hypothetical protein [Algibacter sp. PT7-4]|uniref:hypothetical protein n=1 Tax=Algibacter ulvanivorans TaxID=3400999 RepID=UPI003AAC1910